MTTFDYSNLSGRPAGPFVSLLARFIGGVREVQDQVEPYARWWEERNREALDSGKPLWFVLGDSMSQGIGASGPDRGWVGQLADDAPRALRDAAILNLSFNGARVGDVIDRQLPQAQALVDAGHEAALITVLIGNNDLVSRKWRKKLNASMRELLETLPVGSVIATQPGLQASAVRLNRVILEVARRRRLVVADFRVPWMRDWRGRLAQDHFHPNDRGYAGMADLVRASLT